MVRDYAAQSLIQIGPGAKSALPTLLELLKDNGPFHANLALAAIAIDPDGAKPALTWIRERLTKEGDEDTYDIAESIQTLGPKAKPLLPELLTMLKSKTPYFRENAIGALGAIGPDAKAVLPQLRDIAAKDSRPNVRKAAEEAIKKIEGKPGD
jgi:HEAT repeat protein